MLTRRRLLQGAAVVTALGITPANAWLPHGAGLSKGWNNAPIGAGGLVTEIVTADDGALVMRNDTYGVYRWSGTSDLSSLTDPSAKWLPLLTWDSLKTSVSGGPGVINSMPIFGQLASYAVAMAPQDSNKIALMLPDIAVQGGDVNFAVFITSSAGRSWTKVNDVTNFPTFNNASSNASNVKNFKKKIAYDPNNSAVIYVGMPQTSGNAHPLYRTLDGGNTWDGTWQTAVPLPSGVGGVTCIVIDPSQGTTTASGITVSKRILLGCSGSGVYESFDGGQTFALTSSGPTSQFFNAEVDSNGVFYISSYATNKLWRYDIGASAGGGTWHDMTLASGWPGGVAVNNFTIDRRVGHAGTVWILSGSSAADGFYSSNANAADPNTVTWSGGNKTPVWNAASYDCPWFSTNRTLLLGTVAMVCDRNGTVFNTGAQAIYYYDSPLTFGSASLNLNTVCRGIEQTVTQVACRPPGSPGVVLGVEDVGAFWPDIGKQSYPTTRYPTPAVYNDRGDCTSLDYAQSTPSIMVMKFDGESRYSYETAYHKSAYSGNYGRSWTPYATMPDSIYDNTTATSGGQIIAFDADRHICVPAFSGTSSTVAWAPCYTANATNPASVTWTLCNGLPSSTWCFISGVQAFNANARPLSVGRGPSETGVAYAYDHVSGNLYRSADYGANWSSIGTQAFPFTLSMGPLLDSVPGVDGELWLTGYGHSGTPALYRVNYDGVSTTFTSVAIPGLAAGTYIQRFCLGASAGHAATPANYPTLWALVQEAPGYNGASYITTRSVYRSIDRGTSWKKMDQSLPSGATTQALPALRQFDYTRSFNGDMAVFGLVYLGMIGSGWSYYYNPTI